MLQQICGDPEADSAMLSTYLDLAADIVVHRAYPFLTSYVFAEVPERYATVQVQIANELYLHRGAEGEKDHSENGVKRTYENGYVSDSLLKKIVPYARVIGELIPETVTVNAKAETTINTGKTELILNFTEVICTDKSVRTVYEGYTYTSSDENVATVADGVITAIAAGTATITVTGKRS
ncbi:MAG: hypothetical protein IJV21_01740, partial [Lachnospiraceae bacterium]|nr:hypothetical protein [Lachnospiraceae bacterium]